ncbi:MAG: hypothetical protein QM793_02590 [Muricomes sp.]
MFAKPAILLDIFRENTQNKIIRKCAGYLAAFINFDEPEIEHPAEEISHVTL